MPKVKLLSQLAGERPDLTMLSKATTPAAFFNTAIDLAADLGLLIQRLIETTWQERPGRNEGMLRGLAVRVVKSLDRLVAATAEDNGETQLAFERFTLEAVINLAHLLQGPNSRFDEFAWDSMTTARIRRETIRKNIEARGAELPIERRQLRAIEHEAKLAGCDLDRPVSEWPRLPSVEQRARSVLEAGGELLYDFGYRIGSVGIHGTWKDLLDRHVTSDGRFQPIFEWREADPTPLLGAVTLASVVLGRYAEHLGQSDQVAPFTLLAREAAEVNRLYGPMYEASRPTVED